MLANNPTHLVWKAYSTAELLTNQDLRDQWNLLNALSTNQVFMDAEAVVCALKNFSKGERLYVGTDQGHTHCMTILSRIDALRWTTFQPSQLPLGAFLISPHVRFEATAGSLLRNLPGMALVLSVTQIDPLYVPRPADTPTLRLADHIETGWIELPGTFEEYWAGRSKNLRNNIRKQLNKLAAEGARIDLRRIRTANEMTAAVTRFGDVESAGWKGTLGTAIHKDTDQGRFYSELLTEAALSGCAIVYEYWINGDLAASNLCLKRDKTLVVLKTTYNEKYNRVSPAFLLRYSQIQCAYQANEFQRLEFYGRKRDWHTQWTEHFRTIYHATFYRSGLINRLAQLRNA